MSIEETNYLEYRGRCKELCERVVLENPSLTIVRGYYHDAIWGKQAHWWTVDAQGIIYDPSKLQFPDQNGEYEKFDGYFNCEQCGTQITEEEGTVYGNFIFCSGECLCACVL